jgi:uncharacterized protein
MLQEQITKDYVQAMKAQDKDTASALSFLRAQIKNVVIEKKVLTLDDADVIVVLKKQIKQRQDSIEQFHKGGREDLVLKEKKELELFEKYLPAQATREDIQTVVSKAVNELNAKSLKDMGAVMKNVVVKLEGRADNKIVSELVRQALAG